MRDDKPPEMKIIHCPPGPDFGNQPCRRTGKTPDEWNEISDPSFPERRIFQKIIMQALYDLGSRSMRTDLEKSQARDWLFGGSNHFLGICQDAGWHSELIIKLAKMVEAGFKIKVPKQSDD